MKEDISKCIEIDIVEDCRQQVIINGIPSIAKVAVGKCPKCGKVLFNLGNGIMTLADAFAFCTNNQEALKNQMLYCSACGQKLAYPIMIDDTN